MFTDIKIECQVCGEVFEGYNKRLYCGSCTFNRLCVVEGCDRVVRRDSRTGRCSGALCGTHYSRSIKGIDLSIPIITPAPPGTGCINEDGYRVFKRQGVSVLEHREVMEEVLWQTIRVLENVHHMNGIRDDNRIENLELWIISQPKGQRVEDVISWAEEILARYKP